MVRKVVLSYTTSLKLQMRSNYVTLVSNLPIDALKLCHGIELLRTDSLTMSSLQQRIPVLMVQTMWDAIREKIVHDCICRV
eukprot:2254468-Amphidinium_carterae.2